MGYAPPAWVNYGLTNEDNAPSRQDEDRRNLPKVRIAKVTQTETRLVTAIEVEPYLPANYAVASTLDGLYIVGTDLVGWTLDGYVLPRLASGLIFAEEVK